MPPVATLNPPDLAAQTCATSYVWPDAETWPPDKPVWVLAAPFRAHVNNLIAGARVPWPVVAHQAGVPMACLRTLLFGRGGRVRGKIAYDVALALIEVRIEDLAWLRTAQVSAERTGGMIRLLRSHRVTWSAIADSLRLDLVTCQAMARGERTSCSVMVEILAQSLCAAVGLPSWEKGVR